jgi:nucleoid-associated protein YgaU
MGKHHRAPGRHRAPSQTGRVAARVATAGAVIAAPLATAAPANAEGMPETARDAIIACESGGDPTVQNAHSTASGLYQFVNGTWKLFGGSTARAREASEAEQHAVADRAYATNGLRDWEASRACWQPKVSKAKHAADTAAPRHGRSPPPRHSADSYTVKQGDTLSEIAAAHHTTWQKLYAANRDTVANPHRIYPGERLRV